MKTIIGFIVIYSVLSIPNVYANFNEEVLAREVCFMYALAKDWKQTRTISTTWWRYEQNQILGPKPSLKRVNTYFALCAIGHSAVAFMLPEKYTEIWQTTWIGIQTATTERNETKLYNEAHMGFEYRITYTIKF